MSIFILWSNHAGNMTREYNSSMNNFVEGKIEACMVIFACCTIYCGCTNCSANFLLINEIRVMQFICKIYLFEEIRPLLFVYL